ncbi:alpha/beta hydrolase-fold protein, partial [Flavobacterium hydatis]|uniref:alpha/beta hydrolase-fold protein n=1 Tax=Flavobacterium hydatis TaxID=991 RepID=UPI003395F957
MCIFYCQCSCIRLEKELQPYIDKKFNTSNHKTVIGESLAGLLATEILLKHRNLF